MMTLQQWQQRSSLKDVGRKSNVKSVDNCITRLRLEIKDDNKIDEAKIKSSGVAGIIRPGKVTFRLSLEQKFSLLQMRWKNYVNKPYCYS